MLCGTSFHNKGVQKLLDYVMALCPRRWMFPQLRVSTPKPKKEVTRNASDDEPFSALAFKITDRPVRRPS